MLPLEHQSKIIVVITSDRMMGCHDVAQLVVKTRHSSVFVSSSSVYSSCDISMVFVGYSSNLVVFWTILLVLV